MAFALGRIAAPDRAPPSAAAPLRVEMALGFDGELASDVGTNVALSPDGHTLVFVALHADGSTRLYARSLEELEARELPGTIGARVPFFSPDGRWVGFWAQGRVAKTLVEGAGSPVTIAPSPDLLGASWNESGEIVAALSPERVFWRIPEQGGAPVRLVKFPGMAGYPRWPQWLPGHRAVLFTSVRGESDTSIEAVSLADGTVKTLVRGGTYGRYLPSGHLLYVNRGTLFAVRFDLGRLQIRGAPIPVLDSVAYSQGFGYAELALSDNGRLIYSRNSDEGKMTRMAWLDEAGHVTPALTQPGHYLWPRLSPDGTRLAVSLLEGSDYDIWLYDLRHGTRTRLTEAEGDERSPLWTPDGAAVIYTAASGELRWRPADGSASAAPLLAPPVNVPWSFSPDGRLAFHRMGSDTGFDLWTMPVERDSGGLRAGVPERYYGSRAFDTYPTFSPDGRWIAYASDESGVWEVYVRAFPDDGRAVRISQNGGRIPVWSRRGHELLYETFDHRLMVASYREDGGRCYLAHRLEQIRQVVVYGVRPPVMFREAAEKFLTENAHLRSLDRTALAFDNVMPYIGDLPLERVHNETLAPFRRDRAKEGIKAGTINRDLDAVRRVLNLAARVWRHPNGMTYLSAPPLLTREPGTARKPYPLNGDEQERLLRELPSHLERMALFVLNTGLRDQEICRLRWSWEVQVPELGASVLIIPGEYAKNGEERVVVLNRVARRVLEGERGQHAERVFSYKGRPVGRMLNSGWKRARVRAGLPRLRVHDLRHTFGHRLRAAGVHLEDRKALLAHTVGDVTTHYSAPDLARLLEYANRVCETRATVLRVVEPETGQKSGTANGAKRAALARVS